MSALSDMVARYVRYREIGTKLNMVLVKRLTKDMLEEGGRDLGIFRKGTFVFETEDESSVLMDYCLYDVFRKGRNTIQQLVDENPPPQGSEEALVVEGMSKAWYSIFHVDRVERGAGVWVQDLFRETEHLLLDLNLARSAPTGGMLATRVFPFDGFIMTAGAGLPLQGDIARREKLIEKVTKLSFDKNIRSFGQLSPQQGKELTRVIISTALSWGASANIRYEDVDRKAVHPSKDYSPPERPAPIRVGQRVGRNDPCPCGSGKKFKHCCAKTSSMS